MGEMGLLPDVFWNLTFAEYHQLSRGYFLRNDRHWEHTRFLAALIINRTRFDNSEPAVTPEELVPLGFDKPVVVELIPVEEARKILAEWQPSRN